MTPGEKWANVQADEKSDDLQSCVASTGGELTGQGLPQSLRFSLPVANWPLQSQSQSVHSSRQLRTSMSQRPCECLRSDRPVWRSAGRPRVGQVADHDGGSAHEVLCLGGRFGFGGVDADVCDPMADECQEAVEGKHSPGACSGLVLLTLGDDCAGW